MSTATAIGTETERKPRFAILRVLWQPSTAIVAVLLVLGLMIPSIYGGQVPLLVGILSVLIFAYCWNPVGGMLGEMSLAHVVFWAAGSYSVVLSINAGNGMLLGTVIGVAVALVLAVLIVAFALAARLDGLYLMVFTLVFVHFAQAIVEDSEYLGRAEGIAAMNLPLSIDAIYYLSVVFVAFLILLNMVLLGTRRGLTWLAIRDEPDRVAALGRSTRAERTIAYMLTAALCAIGGALHVAAIGFASPAISLDLVLIVVPLLAIYVGGPGTVWGPLLGVALLETLSTVATENSDSADAAEIAQLLQYCVALAVVMYVMHRQRKRRQAAMVATERQALEGAANDLIANDPKAAGRDRTIADRIRSTLRARRARVELPGRVGNKRTRGAGPLKVEHLRKSFGGLRVLEDVSFKVEPGEVLGLVGPNGAGKSTICNLVAGLIAPDGGRITLGETRMGSTAPHRRVRLGLGRTYQSPRVFPSLTLAENVAIAGSSTGTVEARRLLTRFGVAAPDKLGETATLMERRMVEIARLVALRPQWVLLDEPLAGLAAGEHDHVLALIRELADGGATVLVIEHLVPVIAPITDRIVVLDGGRLIADGPPEKVLREKRVVDAYLGEPIALELTAD